MTAKEKADELCDKIYEVGWANHTSVKTYALICVDEILEVIPTLTPVWVFWNQVKDEINKL